MNPERQTDNKDRQTDGQEVWIRDRWINPNRARDRNSGTYRQTSGQQGFTLSASARLSALRVIIVL